MQTITEYKMIKVVYVSMFNRQNNALPVYKLDIKAYKHKQTPTLQKYMIKFSGKDTTDISPKVFEYILNILG